MEAETASSGDHKGNAGIGQIPLLYPWSRVNLIFTIQKISSAVDGETSITKAAKSAGDKVSPPALDCRALFQAILVICWGDRSWMAEQMCSSI